LRIFGSHYFHESQIFDKQLGELSYLQYLLSVVLYQPRFSNRNDSPQTSTADVNIENQQDPNLFTYDATCKKTFITKYLFVIFMKKMLDSFFEKDVEQFLLFDYCKQSLKALLPPLPPTLPNFFLCNTLCTRKLLQCLLLYN
jgi:hypothetical protein